jgi:hypothetical protein
VLFAKHSADWLLLLLRRLRCIPAAACAGEGPGKGQQFQLGVNDEQRLYSSVELQKLTEAAQVLSDRGLGKAAMQETARHGLSPLLRCLPYQDVHTVSVVPVMHALCQGVIKDWLLAFLLSPNKPQPQRKQGMGASSLPKKRKRRQGQQQGEQQEGEQQQDEQQEGEQQQDGGEQAQQQQQQQQQQGTQPVGKGGQEQLPPLCLHPRSARRCQSAS